MCSASIAAHHFSMNPLSSTRDLYSTDVRSDESDLTTCALRRFLVTNWAVARVAKLAKPPSLAVPKFCAASEKRCKGGYRQVCVKLCHWMSWCLKCIRTLLCMGAQQTYFRFFTQEFNMVGGYMEDPRKTTKLSKLGGRHLPGTMWYQLSGLSGSYHVCV